ncbi:MAG: methylmalonyl Co-A mutase-associated GTPase MeaB [Myxococcota bacterium]|nr:methylmalonyl Co-A mutase-associated GTPase MeaB [Myxococcota bacterium]
MTTTSQQQIELLQSGDLRTLSRLISRVENQDGGALALIADLWAANPEARILGVTGPPGAGKSTFVDGLVSRLRSDEHRVAVLAVDPSSPFSGGAILGDRIRMQSHAADPDVFIRSLGTRGHQGGLSRTTREAAVLCAAAGFDRIVIETVGVGQTELEVVGVAHQVLVLLVPESGDVIQTMKAGLMECADVFVVNKADRGGADRLAVSLVSMLEEGEALAPGESPPVFTASAMTGDGMDELLTAVCGRLDAGLVSPRTLSLRDMAARLFGSEVAQRSAAQACVRLAEGGDLAEEGLRLDRGETNPYAVVRRLLGEDPQRS